MISSYNNSNGFETFIALEADVNLDFAKSVDSLMERYESSLKENGISADSALFIRFHLSDATTQTEQLLEGVSDRLPNTFLSVINQPPASGSKIAMEAYLAGSADNRFNKQVNCDAVIVDHGKYKSIWGSLSPDGNSTTYDQTSEILESLSGYVSKHGGTVKDNVVRTWFYVRDIDNNYQGMVDSRREWFERAGMTRDTHYIASTGIEGSTMCHRKMTIMDYLAVIGITPDQMEFMTALDHLCPTHQYNVTFERGTRIIYGDRAHYFISGTASIDNNGDVLHIGDVIKQTERTLKNISVLLENHEATLEDMKLIMVYLRDGSDYTRVNDYLQKNLPPSIAYTIVTGAVCRPSWLIEMDGIAVTDHNADFPPYC